ncbi:MAG: hypothetical protein ACRD1X_21735 [Vicinamibacteria bacterium]
MKRFWSTRGEVRMSSLLSLAVLIFAVYEGFQFVPVLFAQYEFKDAIVEEAKFSAYKTPETIRDNLLKKAAELRLPIERQDVVVERRPTSTRIQVQYELSVEWLPGQEYWWEVNEDEESVLF